MEACTKYGHGLQYVPTNSVLLCNRAACKSKLEKWEKAIDDCNAALRERPNYHKALLRHAHSYARVCSFLLMCKFLISSSKRKLDISQFFFLSFKAFGFSIENNKAFFNGPAWALGKVSQGL